MELLASVLWPRGLCFAGGRLFALGRGRPRGAGGPDPDIADHAGSIFEVPLSGSGAVETHLPNDPPFHLWDRLLPIHSDIETDRPYAGLAWHEVSQNFLVCCFSGIDKPTSSVAFRKNSTDAVLRFDCRNGRWFEVERHDGTVVPEDLRRSLTTSIPNNYFPSNDSSLPHGWVNGPDGLLVHDNDLFIVGKDNHSLVRYDLTPILSDPEYGHLPSVVLRKDSKDVLVDGSVAPMFDGPSALATDGTYLYVGLRTTDIVLGFPWAGPFDSAFLAATLPSGVELIDLAMSSGGELFVSSKRRKIWNAGVPDPATTYAATDSNVFAQLPGNGSNITFGDDGVLYACCNVDDGGIFHDTSGSRKLA